MTADEKRDVTEILIVVLFILYWRFFKDVSNDVESWYDTPNYDENDKRPLPMDKKN